TVNGQVERTVTQTVTPGAQGWTYTFYNLDKTDGQGNTIEYAVSEKPVPQFTTTVQGGTITNTYAPEKTQVSGTKTWVGVNAADALPASITVNLTGKLADGTQVRTGTQTVTPAADGTWAYSFADLDAYTADNQAITYTLTEDVPAQFTSSVNGYDFTNTYDPEKTSVRGAKVWTGVGDGAALPSQITVNLAGATPDGTVVRTDSQVVQAATDGTWAYLFDNLDAYTADNQAITYTVTEDPIPGYETSIVEGDITNTYTGGASQQLTVTKTWADASNQDGMRPATVRFTVKNGSAVMASADVTGDSTADSWTHTFTGLPKYDTAGQSITYTVEEAAVDGYTTTGGECTYQGDETWAAAFTNTHVPETTSVHVDLTWDDAGDEYSTRPDSVEVELYANGQPTGQRITLTPDGNWEGTFDNLPKYKDGEEITYTVQEVVPNRYSYTIAGDMENGFKLVNTLPQSEIDKIKKQNTNNNTNTTNRTSTTSSTTASTGDTTPVLPFAGLGLLSMLVAVAAAWMARRKDDAA
ncbi:MAG: Cna B-type domain-containing protein, partial [Coriobacteriia bacterium]|nr:Cna B-type domain-containing protein [Coriobacteriia bacterium]